MELRIATLDLEVAHVGRTLLSDAFDVDFDFALDPARVRTHSSVRPRSRL
jgi:hypothetical protein